MPTDNAPIFIIGTGRSGTTLLRQMLSSHPNIHLTHEASFYVWEQDRRQGRLFEDYLQGFHFRYLGIDTERFLRALPPGCTNRQFFQTLMKRAALEHGKTRYGDKTPGHSAHLERIYEDFPNARVVRIVRSPVRVAESLLRMPWFPRSLLLASALINREEKACAAFDDRIHTLRLEDLLEEPEAELRRVLDFVDEPWNAAVLDHTRRAPDDLPPMPWFQRAKTRAGTGLRPALHPAGVKLLESLCGDVRQRHGYAALSCQASVSSRAWHAIKAVLPMLSGIGKLLELHRAFRRGAPEPELRALLLGMNDSTPSDWVVPETPALPAGWTRLLPAAAKEAASSVPAWGLTHPTL